MKVKVRKSAIKKKRKSGYRKRASTKKGRKSLALREQELEDKLLARKATRRGVYGRGGATSCPNRAGTSVVPHDTDRKSRAVSRYCAGTIR